MKTEVDVRDPVLKKMMEGLLALGPGGLSGTAGGEEDCLLRITDDREAARPFRDIERRSVCVLLVPRGQDGQAADISGAEGGDGFAIPVPVFLPEAAAVLAKAARALEERRVTAGNGSAGEPASGARDHGSASGDETGASPRPASSDGNEPDGLLRVSEDFRTAERWGQTVRLTAREAAYFRILCEKRGEAVSREELLAARFPASSPGQASATVSAPAPAQRGTGGKEGKESNLTDVYIGYLRKKLAPLLGDGAILSVRGRGYALRLPREVRIQYIIP